MPAETASQSKKLNWKSLFWGILVVLVVMVVLVTSQGSQPLLKLGKGVEYFVDDTGTLQVQDIVSLSDDAWQQEQDEQLSFGLTPKAHWLRFSIDTRENTSRVLEVDYPLLDELQVWMFSGNNLLQQYQSGDGRVFKQRAIQHENFVFDIPLGQQSVNIYLRAQTAGSMQLPIRIWNKDQFIEYATRHNLIVGLFFGFLLAMMLSNLFLFINSGSMTYVTYSGYVLCLSLTLATFFGLSYQYLWTEWVWLQSRAFGLFGSLTLMCSLLFSVHLIEIKQHSPRLFQVFKVASVFMGLMALAGILMPVTYHIRILLPLIAVVMGLKLTAGVLMWRKGVLLSRFYTLSLSVLLACVLIAGLDNTGLLTSQLNPEYPLMLGVTFETFLLALALGKHYTVQRENQLKHQYQALMEERHARTEQEQLLRIKEEAQEELEYKVQERTLELEIALRELSETNQELEKMNTTDALTGLRNRRYFDKKYQAEARRSRREQTELSVVMIDIDHFKSINDKYGHVIGDECLRQVAAVLQQCLKRPSDDACRYGGEEFALILPATDQPGAKQLTEQMRASIENLIVNTAMGNISFTISAGICTAVIQREGQEINLLEQADEALYQAKNAGRNRICGCLLSEAVQSNQELT